MARSDVANRPADPHLAGLIRQQVAEAKVANIRKTMLDQPVEDITDSETAAVKQQGGAFTVTSSGRDRITLWHVRSGVPSRFMYYEVGKRLQDMDDTGRAVWTLDESEAAEQPVGTYMCYLNPAHPNFAFYHDIVGKVCGEAHGMAPKAGIPNRFQQRQHMQKKHKSAWEAIREEEERIRRDEDREMSRRSAEAMEAVIQRGERT